MKKIYFLLGFLFVVLVTIFGISIYFNTKNPEFDLVSTVAGFASFFIAILTILYVYTTSKQLEVMSKST
jgi:hypothetical protein